MSRNSEKIASLIRSFEGRDLDPHYLGYFECFNQQLFFEAHEVLEELWLSQRGQDNDSFYKGLIQLAGAFVHVQKKRRQPAVALFRLAEANLSKYRGVHLSLQLQEVRDLIRVWITRLERDGESGASREYERWPRLKLIT